VQIQVGSRWARMSPYEMAKARGQGKKVAVLVNDKKGRPWKANKPQQAAHENKGKKGQSKSKSQSKGHSNGN
jgi:hypothetical protein